MIALSCGIDGCETVHVSTLETVEGALVDAILDAGWSSEPEDEVPVLCGGCTELVADGAVYSCEECGALAYPPEVHEATLCATCYGRRVERVLREVGL